MVLLFTQLVDSVKPEKINTILIDNSAAPMLNFTLAIWTKFYKSLSANQKKTNPTFCWCFCLCKSFFTKFTIAPSTSISFCLKTEIFLCGLAYRRHVFRRNGHRKRIFSKRLSRVKTLASPFTCGRTKTDVFEYNDTMHHLLLAEHMLRKGCHRISIDWRFRRDRRKRFQYATCQ